jgi:hypothetical protein
MNSRLAGEAKGQISPQGGVNEAKPADPEAMGFVLICPSGRNWFDPHSLVTPWKPINRPRQKFIFVSRFKLI